MEFQRATLNALLWCGALVLFPSGVRGQSSPVVGVVVSTGQAQIRSTGISPGTNVYSGDVVVTAKGSGVAIRAGQVQVFVHEASTVGLYTRGAGVVLELEQGSVAFSRAPGEALEIFAADVRISPADAEALVGEVRMVDACQLRVTSQTGALRVDREKDTRMVAEKSVLVAPNHSIQSRGERRAPGDPQFHNTHTHGVLCKGPAAPGTSVNWFVPAVIMEGATAAAVVLAYKQSVSPSRP